LPKPYSIELCNGFTDRPVFKIYSISRKLNVDPGANAQTGRGNVKAPCVTERQVDFLTSRKPLRAAVLEAAVEARCGNEDFRRRALQDAGDKGAKEPTALEKTLGSPDRF
jgi:hypothetical protein